MQGHAELRLVFWFVVWLAYALRATFSRRRSALAGGVFKSTFWGLLTLVLGPIVVFQWTILSVLIPLYFAGRLIIGPWLSLSTVLVVGMTLSANLRPKWVMWLILLSVLPPFDFVFRQGRAAILWNRIAGDFAKLEVRSQFHLFLMSISLLLCAWALWSIVASGLAEPVLSLAPTRFQARDVALPWRGKRVAVALSGGGYRAALMHAGVLAALDHYQIGVSTIASVSGGSIIGTYYALGGNLAEFVAAVSRDRFNVLDRFLNVRSVGMMIGLSTRQAQAKVLDDTLYRGVTLAGARIALAPRLMILATDITTGETIGITDEGCLRRNTLWRMSLPADSDAAKGMVHGPGDLDSWVSSAATSWLGSSRISVLVSASGAFPLVFDTLDVGGMQLADGGISDNSGMTGLLDMDYFAQFCTERKLFQDWKQDLIITSNASAIFEPTRVYFSRLASPQRAIDIAYSHVEMRPLYFEVESTRRYAPSSVELSPGLLIAATKRLTNSVREIEVDGDFIYHGIKDLAPPERIWLARWLLNQPGVDQSTLKAMEGFAKGDGNSFEILAASLAKGQEIERDLYAFLAAQTLTSNYTEGEANRVFRLGFFLAALSIGSFERSIQLTREARPSLHGCPSFR